MFCFFFSASTEDTPALPEAKTSRACYREAAANALHLNTAPGLYEADLGGLLAGGLVRVVGLLDLSEKNKHTKNTHTEKDAIEIPIQSSSEGSVPLVRHYLWHTRKIRD